MTPILQIKNVTKRYGGLTAVNDVSFDVKEGEILSVIGPNGAGKSTLFGILSGRVSASAGTISYAGNDVTSLNEISRARLGLQQTMQHSSLFPSMTTLDNVCLAVQRTTRTSLGVWRRTDSYREVIASAMAHLDQVGLAERAPATVGELSHGERRQLEVAVALAAEPDVLMLDEPAAGMSPAETARLSELITQLTPHTTVMLVEHDVEMVMSLATVVTVLNLGNLIATGTPAEITENPEVQAAYLSGSSSELTFTDTPGVAHDDTA